MNCDPASLTDSAKCIEGYIPPGMQLPVLISLLCRLNTFQTATFPLSAATLNTQVAHGLSAAPTYLRAVLLCTTNDAASGINAGTEAGLESFFTTGFFPPCGYGADATNIFASCIAGTTLQVSWKGAYVSVTSISNFALKLYWRA